MEPTLSKGIIYYTNNDVDGEIADGVKMFLFESHLPITSSSLKPMKFGNNEVVEGKSGYPTMVKQIVSCLQRSEEDYVFFCEHDVLYNRKYFEFTPALNDTFYYNLNNWRWDFPNNRLIRYDGLTSLSQMSCYRLLALEHFTKRLKAIEENIDQFNSREPDLPRKWGYEPGRKPTTNGGLSDDKSEDWASRLPNIDIRHSKTYSPPKVNLDGFKHLPTGWQEAKLDDMEGWNLRELFNVWT